MKQQPPTITQRLEAIPEAPPHGYYAVARCIGARLRNERIALGIGQDRAALRVRTSRSHIRAVERGMSIPNIYVFLCLCKLYQLDPGDLIHDLHPEIEPMAPPIPRKYSHVRNDNARSHR